MDAIACSIRRHPTGFAEWMRMRGSSCCQAPVASASSSHARTSKPTLRLGCGETEVVVETDLVNLTRAKEPDRLMGVRTRTRPSGASRKSSNQIFTRAP
jgi:hypothetical protein